jgi:SAM-dependent methyltransferase
MIKKSKIFSLCFGLIFVSGLSGQQHEFWQDFYKWDVPYVPTPIEVVDKMLEMVNIKPSDILYDLGCGDGRIVIRAAIHFGIKGIGVDIDPMRIHECHTNAAKAKVEDKVLFLEQDLYEVDISRATVVTLYLLNSVNLKLRPRLLNELKPGTRVISHDFHMGDWETDNFHKMRAGDSSHTIHFWVVPANFSGVWKFAAPPELSETMASLKIEQKFQRIQGQLQTGETIITIKEARVEGDRIYFIADQKKKNSVQTWVFEGYVREDRIVGNLHLRSKDKKIVKRWRAERDPATKKPIDPGTSNLGMVRLIQPGKPSFFPRSDEDSSLILSFHNPYVITRKSVTW